eukprot:TRINITY_DN7981_c0_g2_i2.p1 TRINITY_DN7981_c0_g2~~TRINITY_DN7981_c0_g2_i2.p1  ORF type:complete len:300 (-),score=129.45 TRINITY_DN7981_c0_g2_i2:71-970(-)
MRFFFFFFKQKTAYEMLRSLVGSEMCIRDRYGPLQTPCQLSVVLSKTMLDGSEEQVGVLSSLIKAIPKEQRPAVAELFGESLKAVFVGAKSEDALSEMEVFAETMAEVAGVKSRGQGASLPYHVLENIVRFTFERVKTDKQRAKLMPLLEHGGLAFVSYLKANEKEKIAELLLEHAPASADLDQPEWAPHTNLLAALSKTRSPAKNKRRREEESDEEEEEEEEIQEQPAPKRRTSGRQTRQAEPEEEEEEEEEEEQEEEEEEEEDEEEDEEPYGTEPPPVQGDRTFGEGRGVTLYQQQQ